MLKQYRNVSLPEELYTKLETIVELKQAGYVETLKELSFTAQTKTYLFWRPD